MNFATIPAGTSLFIDANVFIYHFMNHPAYGAPSTDLLKRVELGQLHGVTSAHVLADLAHRLMTLEIMQKRNWPMAGLAARLRRHHDEIPAATLFRQAVTDFHHLGVHVVPLTQALVAAAVQLSQQHELLTDDALVVAVMQQHGLAAVASLDADFDRVPGVTRYTPI